ncbi:NAD-binding protein [Pandoraea fibrosis]|uniref:NAD-binding protein n=1 Tax=Pandoraea fibrosis TaxID=1891094 RepID=A0ABX6HR46_9BURK|nr:NAD(P)-dependent oxidoreductase [Pandoraea fibrosis]QHE93087.1 NAD-binding protein [Pandoraea fibrosis]QHF13354.1 NAD-binding protein [Pandoraea fibrosis]
MSRVGFVGLGDMGLAMARNLIGQGHEVIGFDVREAPGKLLVEAGGRFALSLADVGKVADAVFVMVMNEEQMRAVVHGEGGLITVMRPGSTVIVTSTVSDTAVQELQARLSSAGIHLLDAPVSGGQFGAEAGTLALMVAGQAAVLEENRPLLAAVGRTITHVGEEIGLGQATKAALQALIGATFAALCEAMVLGRKAGIPGDKLAEVFSESVVGSPLVRNTTNMILARRFSASGAHVGTIYKDLGISMGLARRHGVAMFTTSAAYEVMQATISMYPEGDIWAATQLLEKMAGLEG